MTHNRLFNIPVDHPPIDGLTISTKTGIEAETQITCFSLGAGTDISPEAYESEVLYYVLSGSGTCLTGESHVAHPVQAGDLFFLDAGTLAGMTTDKGIVYTEIMPGKDLYMNKLIHSAEVFQLAGLIPYEKDSIVNLDIASNDAMKFVIMAFDEGPGLSPHRAPGDALVFALEGQATIGYEGEDYSIKAGETFRFDKNGLHSVKADGQFKMALLLVLK